jgi:hypothetical protein
MKFGTDVLSKKPSIAREFRENWRAVTLYLTLGCARISTRTFHISWPTWVKFGTWDLHNAGCVLYKSVQWELHFTLGRKKPFALFWTFPVWFTYNSVQATSTKHNSVTASFVKSTNWRHASLLGVCRRFVKIGVRRQRFCYERTRNNISLCALKPHHILKVQNDFASCLLRTIQTICKLVTGEMESVYCAVQVETLNKIQASVRPERANLLPICDHPKFNTWMRVVP